MYEQSPFQLAQEIDVDGFGVSVNHHQDGQSDGYFRGSHCHNKEDKNLPGRITMISRECNQQKIYGIQHEFDAHENNDGISPEQHTQHTDTEKHCT